MIKLTLLDNRMKLSQLQSKHKQVVTTIQEMKLINSQKDGQVAERNEHIRILQEECADFKDQVGVFFCGLFYEGKLS